MPPWKRLRAVRALVNSGVNVEVRLEPLIAGLTDSRENLKPLFAAIARTGVRRVVSHYLFLHSSITESLSTALTALECGNDIFEGYVEGPVFDIGSVGRTKHLPGDVRCAGLARLTAWGAEHGLLVETGAAQNPDLRQSDPSSRQRPEPPSAVRLPSFPMPIFPVVS